MSVLVHVVIFLLALNIVQLACIVYLLDREKHACGTCPVDGTISCKSGSGGGTCGS